MTKTQRIAPGHYTVLHHLGTGLFTGLSVSVVRFAHLRGWIATAGWDMHLHTDAVSTKADAVRNAQAMIADEAAKRRQGA